MSPCSFIEIDTKKSVIQNIQIILNTQKGQDIHRPDFGSNLYLFLDKPINSLIQGEIYSEIISAIEEYEPRVNILSIDIKNISSSNIQILLKFEIKSINEVVELWI